ncbi:hypothetical protein EJ08DRAFT_286888 [Tothia fuscella]|uniref:Carbohydrate esterase family 16 protein n=1 Tax=Tothia fuscella TaxID=1048955 RepID=A0A9P4U484_9PEZI|nr:hypothetical protein EJ08DRAFT_286888 [Tothia fuscella]
MEAYIPGSGDSYSQTGFNVAGPQPNVANPIGNPPYPGWTSCPGPNWIGYLTTTYNRSTVLTYNLADGGATVDGDLIKSWRPEVKSLITQVRKEYIPTYGNKPEQAPWTDSNSLFAFWIGINDIGMSYWDNNSTRADTALKEYAELWEDIYKTGGRNFLFLNVPPLHRAPLTVESGNNQSVGLELKAINEWNSKLSAMADKFKASHPGVTTFVFSTFDVFNQIMDKPASFPPTAELANTNNFCAGYAGTPSTLTKPANGCKYALNQYFWLNNLHPTSPVHEATAMAVGKALEAGKANLGQKCAASSPRKRSQMARRL